MLSEVRPWGKFEGLSEGPGFLVKRITVNPGGRLSLQKHKHRAERWVVAAGQAVVTRNDEVHRLNLGEMIEIPLGSCLLYTSPSPRDQRGSRMPSSA